MAQTIEAVIISGARRGEIVQLKDDVIPELSEADLELLNNGLDNVIAAIDRLSSEYHMSTEALLRAEATA